MATIAIVNSILISLVLISLLSLVTAFIVLKKFKKKEQTPAANATKPELIAIKELERKLEKITDNQGKSKDELKELLNQSTVKALERKGDLVKTINQSKSELNKLLNQQLKENEALKGLVEKKNEALTGNLKEVKTELKTELKASIKRADELVNDFKKLREQFSKGTQHTGAIAEFIGNRMIERIGGIDYQGTNKYLTFSYQEPFKTIDNQEVRPDLTIRGNDKEEPTTYLDVKWPKNTYQSYLKEPHNKQVKTAFINSLKNDVKNISNKYLEKIAFKAEFAILFLPSDRLFEVAINLGSVYGVAKDSKQQLNYIELCFEYRVVPTSPATLIAVISTLKRYYALFKKLKGQTKNIVLIEKWLKRSDAIEEKLIRIIDLASKITKKADEIKGQMKLNCKTAAELPSPAE